jgi:hypothetical protein
MTESVWLHTFEEKSFIYACEIIRMTKGYGEEQTLWRSSFCNFLQSPVILSVLGPNNFLSIVFSVTFNLHSSINVKDQVLRSYKTTDKLYVFLF